MIDIQIRILKRALEGRKLPALEILSNVRFWLIDRDHKVEITFDSPKKWLRVNNPNSQNFVFVRVDGEDSVFGSNPPPVENDSRFIFDKDGNRAGACDCLIIDEKVWHFIEFKTESTSEKLEQIQINRTKGELQMARTISFFQNFDPNFSNFAKALLVVPKSFAYPRFRADKSRLVKFKLKWKVSLEEISLDDSYQINIS